LRWFTCLPFFYLVKELVVSVGIRIRNFHHQFRSGPDPDNFLTFPTNPVKNHSFFLSNY
jgi:hypothetical protein